MMLQRGEPEDFLIASGQTHSVRDICRVAFEYLDLAYNEYVRIDPRFIVQQRKYYLLEMPQKQRKY